MRKVVLLIILFMGTSCQYLKQDSVAPDKTYYENQWERAVLLIRSQRFDDAEVVLKELYSAAQAADPELSTKALFELAQISEKKGEWLAALSQFKECESKKNYLQGFKAELELPARLAGLYATLGELKVSEGYAKKVESNIQVYMQQISLTNQKGWWAETFYRMGSFPTEYITSENWQEFARRFHFTSQYLIRSMELSDPTWSDKSLELALTFYRKSFEFLSLSPNDLEENSVLLGTQVRERINLLQEIMQKTDLYRPVNYKKSRAVWYYYQATSDYQNQLRTVLPRVKESAPLSRESQKRNSLEREGKLVTPSSGGIDKNLEDPNL